jgi:integrase
VKHKSGADAWLVDARIAGKGERFFFPTATEADTKADLLRVERKNTGDEGARMSARLRADAMEAERELAAVGATIRDAVKYFLANARPAGGERTLRELVDEFIATKRAAGRKETYLEVQAYVLGSVFAGEFGTRKTHEVNAPEIETWMAAKQWSLRTRLNYFTDLRNLFGFAVRRGYRSTNPLLSLEKPSVTEKSPGILTVEQASALLAAATAGEGEMLPPVALGLFAGLRTAELELLDWRNVDLKERNIHVPPEISKTREGRDVAISDNLFAWLKTRAKASGKVAPPKSYDWRLSQKATEAGIADWPKNALRHSFASYHLKHHSNAPLTASMLGHQGSTQTLFRKYQKRVTPADAAAFWKLSPEEVAEGKIAALSRLRKSPRKKRGSAGEP